MYKIFSSWLFYFMLAHFFLLVILLCLNFKYLYREVRKIKKRTWIILLLIFLFGFYLRNSEYWLGPFIDGYVYQESAHMWLIHGNFVKSCALGNQADCQLFEQVLFLPGFPFLIALVHLVFGVNSLNASVLSGVLSGLTIILVFLFAYQLFRKISIGLLSAFVYAIIPINILYSQTGLSRPSALFFMGIVLVSYFTALKNNKFISWLLFVVSFSYLIYIRPEVYMLIPLFLIFFAVYNRKRLRSFFLGIFKKQKTSYSVIIRFAALALLFLFIQIPALNWLLFNNPIKSLPGGGFYGLNFSGIFLMAKAALLQFFNTNPYGINFFHYLFLCSALSLFGFIFIFFKRKKESYFIIFLFLTYFIITILFNDSNIAGKNHLTSDYFRRSLMFHIPYSVFAGYGLYLVFRFIRKRSIYNILYPVIFISVLLILAVTINNGASGTRADFENYNVYKNFVPPSLFKDKRSAKVGDKSLIYPSADYWDIIEEIPNNCLVITSRGLVVTNDYFKDNKRKLAQTDLIHESTEDLFIKAIANSECVYYIKDRQCDPPYDEMLYLCKFLNEKLDKEMLPIGGGHNVYKIKLKES